MSKQTKMKWVEADAIGSLHPEGTKEAFLQKKLAVKTEKSLISMLNDLEGNDFDMLGLDEFKTLLGGK